MVNMTVAEFIAALGTTVTTITYDTSKAEGVILSDDGLTANVYNVAISGSFGGSNKFPSTLVTANLRGLNTSNVTNISYMFFNCSKLTSVDLSSFDTSNVTSMRNMFVSCSKLTSVDLSSFDTSNISHIGYIFSGCIALTSVDLSSFDTSNVTTMSSMFNGCKALTSVDLSNFDTSKVTDMSNMFNGCKALTNVDLSSFDTSKVTSSYTIFSGCSCSVYISSKWTLDKTSISYGATNLTFLQVPTKIEKNVKIDGVKLATKNDVKRLKKDVASVKNKIGYIDVDVSGIPITNVENNWYYSNPFSVDISQGAKIISANLLGSFTVGSYCLISTDQSIQFACSYSTTLPSGRKCRVVYMIP